MDSGGAKKISIKNPVAIKIDQKLSIHLIFILILLICISVRIYIFYNTYIIASDSVQYIDMAQLIREGKLHNALHHVTPPVYSVLIAAVMSVFSDAEIAGKVVSFFLSIATMFPLFYLGKKFFPTRIVMAGLFFYAVHPFMIKYSAEVLSECTFIFLSVTGFALVCKWLDSCQHIPSILAGFLFGLSSLTRPQGIIWLPATIAIFFVFLRLKFCAKNDIRRFVQFFLFFVIYVVIIFPYAYFLKKITGEWTIRQFGSGALWRGTGQYGSSSLWETIIAILANPLLLFKKIILNLGSLAVFLPEGIFYPFFLFLIIGILLGRSGRNTFGEIFIGIICCTYLIFHMLLYFKVRYLLPIVPLALFLAGAGFWYVVDCTQRLFLKYFSCSNHNRLRYMIVLTLCIILILSVLPRGLEPQRLNKVDRKVVGERIAALSPERPVIFSSDPRVAFYAKGEVVFPIKIKNFEELLKVASSRRVDIIVMDKKRVNDKGELGSLVRDFFANAGHPNLRLLFIYPPKSVDSSSIFYVYRYIRSTK